MTKYAFLEVPIDRFMRKEARESVNLFDGGDAIDTRSVNPGTDLDLADEFMSGKFDRRRFANTHLSRQEAIRIIDALGPAVFDRLQYNDPMRYAALTDALQQHPPVEHKIDPVMTAGRPGFFERNLPVGGQTLDDVVSDVKDYAGTVGRNYQHALDEIGAEGSHLAARLGLESPEEAQWAQERFDKKWRAHDPMGIYDPTAVGYTQPTDEKRPLYTRDPRKFWPSSDIRDGGVPLYYTDDYGNQIRVDENGNEIPKYLSYDPFTGEPMAPEYYRDDDKNGTVHWPHPVYVSDGKSYDAMGNEVRENPSWAKAKPIQQTISGISQSEYDALMRRAADEQGYAESMADNWLGSSVLGKALGMQHTPFEAVTYVRDNDPATGERSNDLRDVRPVMRRAEQPPELVPAVYKDENGNLIPMTRPDGEPVYQYSTELQPSTSAYGYYTGADRIENKYLRWLAQKGAGTAGLAAETFARVNPVTGPFVNLADAAAETSRENYLGAGLDLATAGLASRMKPAGAAGKSLLGVYAGKTAKNAKGLVDSFRHVPFKSLTAAGDSAFAASHPVLATLADGAGWLGRGAAYTGKQVAEPMLRVGRQIGMMPYEAVAAKYGIPGGLATSAWGGKEILAREGIGNPHAGELDIPSKEVYDRFNEDQRVPQGWFGKPMYEEPYNKTPGSVVVTK